jgi:hypothetical protein
MMNRKKKGRLNESRNKYHKIQKVLKITKRRRINVTCYALPNPNAANQSLGNKIFHGMPCCLQ